MGHQDDTIPEHMVKRAAEIWRRALAAPIYRNTRPGEAEHEHWEAFNAVVLGGAPKNNTADVLDKFAEALRDLLTNGLLYTPSYGDRKPYMRKSRSLQVDYHPDAVLQEAAGRAGLKMEFPIKTHMWIDDQHVSFSMGYGAPDTYHYPMPGGRWLMTTLRGSQPDVDALVAYVDRHGAVPFAVVENAAEVTA